MNAKILCCFCTFCFLLLCNRFVDCGISEYRFQKLFRLDLSSVKRISWREWVKKHIDTSNGFQHTTKGACCDVGNDTCDSSLNLQCINYKCTCRMGTFLNENNGQCEKKDGKQLTESCTPNDNCFTAFSICTSDVCQCMTGFKPDGLECVPKIYRCPFGDPSMTGTRPQQCNINDVFNSTSDQCPSGYECIYAQDPYRPKYTSMSGEEKGYCCPLIPDLNQAILFQDQCLYGDWVPALECPPSTHVYAFAISAVPICCPKPCRPNYSSTIINGQCVEGILS